MTYKEFTTAIKNHKEIKGSNGNGQVWRVCAINESSACIELSIKTLNNQWKTLHNIMTTIEAYEIIEVTDIKWYTED